MKRGSAALGYRRGMPLPSYKVWGEGYLAFCHLTSFGFPFPQSHLSRPLNPFPPTQVLQFPNSLVVFPFLEPSVPKSAPRAT